MINHMENAFKLLGFRENIELPFEEDNVERTKEQCYDLVRGVCRELVNAGVGPYTIIRFKKRANAIAQEGGEWDDYFELCAEYVERNLMRRSWHGGNVISYQRHEEKWPW